MFLQPVEEEKVAPDSPSADFFAPPRGLSQFLLCIFVLKTYYYCTEDAKFYGSFGVAKPISIQVLNFAY